jgi:hypothetical protein
MNRADTTLFTADLENIRAWSSSCRSKEDVMNRRSGTGASLFARCALLFALVGAQLAQARNPSFEIDQVTPMGTFGGRPYVEVEGVMVGTIDRADGSRGSYRAPFRAAFPRRGGNGVAVLTPVNSAAFANYPPESLSEPDLGDTTLWMVGDYLFRNGYTYMAFGWNKLVTDLFGEDPPQGADRALAYGTIQRGSDGTEILKDAARIIRHVQPWTGHAVSTVLGIGHSQTGMLLSGFVRAGHNRGYGRLLYDGILASGEGGLCAQTTDVGPTYTQFDPCFGPTPAGLGKVVVVQMESDLPFFRGGTTRGESPTYRVYEFAGISHIPKPYLPLGGEYNASRQNPADMGPGYRAAIANLVSWVVDRVEPPPSVYLEGTVAADGTVTLARDADGNALGGVRMPHMPQVLDGRPAGAPLGEYNGIEPRALNPFDLFAALGGYFEPFSAAELKSRYRTRGEYIQRVKRSARALHESRFILAEDYVRYVVDSARQPLWPRTRWTTKN